MRKKERIYEDDDGRTIADMSGIEPQPLLVPRIHRRRDRADFREPDAPAENDRPWDTSGELSREERNAAIGGALKAGLLIGGVFLAAGALAILAMQAHVVVTPIIKGITERWSLFSVFHTVPGGSSPAGCTGKMGCSLLQKRTAHLYPPRERPALAVSIANDLFPPEWKCLRAALPR